MQRTYNTTDLNAPSNLQQPAFAFGAARSIVINEGKDVIIEGGVFDKIDPELRTLTTDMTPDDMTIVTLGATIALICGDKVNVESALGFARGVDESQRLQLGEDLWEKPVTDATCYALNGTAVIAASPVTGYKRKLR